LVAEKWLESLVLATRAVGKSWFTELNPNCKKYRKNEAWHFLLAWLRQFA
jgi:hypothetical protein